tara:strand:+ start:1203 stop:1454 length:252 start_codon:yes stop_codon:yes gene_type:complete
MCICINCRWIDRCITYHDVENNHGVNHICDVPDFKAKKPVIHVSIVKDNNGEHKTDWDVRSCESFTKEYGKWSKCNPGLELPI